MVALSPWVQDFRSLFENFSVTPLSPSLPATPCFMCRVGTASSANMSTADRKWPKQKIGRHSRGVSLDNGKQRYRLSRLSSQVAEEAKRDDGGGETKAHVENACPSISSCPREDNRPNGQSSDQHEGDSSASEVDKSRDDKNKPVELSRKSSGDTDCSSKSADSNNNAITNVTNTVRETEAGYDITSSTNNKSKNSVNVISDGSYSFEESSKSTTTTSSRTNGLNSSSSNNNIITTTIKNNNRSSKNSSNMTSKNPTVTNRNTQVKTEDQVASYRTSDDDTAVQRYETHISDRLACFSDDALNKSLLLASDLPSLQTFMLPAGGGNDSGRFGNWHPPPPKAPSQHASVFSQSKSVDNEKPSPIISKDQNFSNSFIAHNIAVYDRLQRLDRNRMFEFRHYPDEPARYIREYRSAHTVGRVGREDRRRAVIGRDVADPYTYLPTKRLNQGNAVVKSWQQRLVEEQLMRKPTQEPPRVACCPDPQHHVEKMQPQKQQQQQQQQQQQEQPQHHHYHLHHNHHPDDPTPSPPPQHHYRYFPTLAPTREATAFIRGIGANKARILLSQLSRSKSLSLLKSSSEDVAFLPTIPSQDKRVSLVRHSNDVLSGRSGSKTSDRNGDSGRARDCLPSSGVDVIHKVVSVQSLHKINQSGSTVDLKAGALLNNEVGRREDSKDDSQDVGRISFSDNGEVNESKTVAGRSHSCPLETHVHIPDSGTSESPTTDPAMVSLSSICHGDSEDHAENQSSRSEIMLRTVWKNPDEFERKYCPQKDKTILSNRSFRGNAEEGNDGQATDKSKNPEGKKRLSRDNDFSQLIIEVTNLRLESPLCPPYEDANLSDSVKIFHSELSQKNHKPLPPDPCGCNKRQGHSDHARQRLKEKDFPKGGNRVEKSRRAHQCSRFHTNHQLLDFDGACRYHAREDLREDLRNGNKDVQRGEIPGKRFEQNRPEVEVPSQKLAPRENNGAAQSMTFSSEEFTLELKGIEYKATSTPRINGTDSKIGESRSYLKGQHISVSSSIEEVSRCNDTGSQLFTGETKDLPKAKLSKEESLNTCLQTVSKGKTEKSDQLALPAAHKPLICDGHDGEIESNKAPDPSTVNPGSYQSYQLEEWKTLVDSGDCGFIVRAIPVAKRGSQTARETATVKDSDLSRKTKTQSRESLSDGLETDKSVPSQPHVREISEKPIELEIIGSVTTPVNLVSGKHKKETADSFSKSISKGLKSVSRSDLESCEKSYAEDVQEKGTLEPSLPSVRTKPGDSNRLMIPLVNLDLDLAGLSSPEETNGHKDQDSPEQQQKRKTEPPLLQVWRPPVFDLHRLSSWRQDMSSTSNNSHWDGKSTVLASTLSETNHAQTSYIRNNSFMSHRVVDSDRQHAVAGAGTPHATSADQFSIDNIKIKPELQLYAHIRKGLCCGKKAEELFQKLSNVNGHQVSSSKH